MKTSSVIGILMMMVVVVGCSGQLGALTAAESDVTQDGSVLDAGATTDALSPNPCTAVALVAPTGGFAGQVGVAQPLSASATCPPGQTPEYQFWGKRSTDSNWTVLGSGYNAGSSSYTPVATDAGSYCYSVVVRAVGATENYQARSGATCGTIADATGQTPPTGAQLVIPAAAAGAPINSAAFLAIGGLLWRCTSAIDHIIYPIKVAPGMQLHGATLWSVNRSGLPVTVAIRRAAVSTGTVSTIATASGLGDISLAFDHTIDSAFQYIAEFSCGGFDDDARALSLF